MAHLGDDMQNTMLRVNLIGYILRFAESVTAGGKFMKYILPIVYQAAALDEIYSLLRDELDLTTEDLKSCADCRVDLHDPEAKFTDVTLLRDNLNLTPVQDTLQERIAVLKAKIVVLNDFMSMIKALEVSQQEPLSINNIPF